MTEMVLKREISASQFLVAAAVVFSLVYIVGLSHTEQLHEIFHDARHALGFACH